MGVDDVTLICYFGGKLIDEDRDARYIGGKIKNGKVPKSIKFASFKQKLQQMMCLPSSGMEFKIKCGVRYDEVTLIGVDVDDDESLQSIVDDSKFIRAYILVDLQPATTFTASKWEDHMLPSDVGGNSGSQKTPNDAVFTCDGIRNSNDSRGFEQTMDAGISQGAFKKMQPVLERNEFVKQNDEVWKQDLTSSVAELKAMVSHFVNPNSKRNRLGGSPIPIDGTSNNNSVGMNTTGVSSPDNDGMNTNKGTSQTENELREWFPENLLPLITKCASPERDGNCGFRALCMALRRNEGEWAEMRAELVKEIESKKNFYDLMFGIEDTCKLIQGIWHLKGSAPQTNWMDMPSTGFVFAQAFKVVLVYYSKQTCCTFVPFLSPPGADNVNVKILGIGLVENNHYIKLDFRYGCALPPFPFLPSNWRKIRPDIVDRWEELLVPRFNAFKMMNVPELQAEKCLAPIVLDGEDLVSPSAPTQNVNEHGDVNFIDISKVEIYSLEETHHRFTQSNIDLQDEVMNSLISNKEDDEGGEVNMQDRLSEEKQFSSQMEEMAPVPVCTKTSEKISLSDNDFDVDREFEDIEAFRNSLSDWAVKTGHEYRPVRKTPSTLTMKCASDGCKWYIRVSQSPNMSAFKVVKYQGEHSCSVSQRSCGGGDHKQATIKWIVSKMQSSIEKDPEMEPMKIVKEIKDKFGIKISYNKAVKAKTRVVEVMRGLPWLVKELEKNGSVAKGDVGSKGIQHFFWAFQACIDALHNHLRPVVYVGSVNIEAGVLMFARGFDGDSLRGNFIDVGFGYYYNYREEEKCSMWETYLGWLKEFVLPPTTAEGIPFSIVTEFEETGAVSGAVENVLPHLHHFFNPDSFAPDFFRKFKACTSFSTEKWEAALYHLCHQACTSFTTEKHEAALQKIKAINEEAYLWLLSSSVGPKSRWAIAFSPNKHVLAVGEDRWFSFDFYSVEEKWSIVESSRERVANYFSKRRREGEEAAKTTTGLPPRVIKEIQRAKECTAGCKVKLIDGHKYQISLIGHQISIVEEAVDLAEKSCTCGEFQATEYPCEHAMVTIAHLNLDVRNYFNHRWYSLDAYRATYAGIIPLAIIPTKRKVGRPKKLCKT